MFFLPDCFRFLTSSLSCRKLAHNFLMGYETVRIIVNETTEAIWKILLPIVMPAPTKEMWKKIEQDFADKWNYPNCVGAIDGKHVVVQAPRKSGSLFFNYKKTFSVVLLAIADANYKFIAVDVGSYGRNSDGGILSSSTFGKNLLRQQLDLPDEKVIPGILNPMPHVFVGDEAFPILKNLMRPYPKDQIQGDQSKKVYNYRHSRARRVVEQSFGILAQKFEIYQKRIKFQPNQLENLILSTVCLHNYILDDEVQVLSTRNERARNLRDLDNTHDQDQLEPITVRDNFKQYFNSDGAVSWQLHVVNRN